ncbi:E7 [Ailuropoda melanoleuca papillomavirus 4]|uniref:Protein E7 n=1 Tax=Ailuropoda melanoleuca papillomavirus 4 TaxID=2016453 RepID=A0A220IGE6_9PAPI|nr:E7 [Ailuropoda melanoleuca papillomavirus 4]
MIGKEASLKDIVLEEQPNPVDDLWCDEELPPEEAEPLAPYRVQAPCGHCDRCLQIVVFGTRTSIRALQVLLQDDLAICCRDCAYSRRYHHGG